MKGETMIERLFVFALCCLLAFIVWDASTQPVRPHLDAYGDAVSQKSRTQKVGEWAAGAIWRGFAGEDR